MSNPFNELYEIMGDSTKIAPSFFIAKVSNPLPNLKIVMENTELDREDFLVSKNLIITNNANVSSDTCNISHNLKDELRVGDELLVIRVNDAYIILEKVVSI